MRIHEILDTYLAGSGQLVNKSKSDVFFSKNCDKASHNVVLQSLGIDKEALEETYMGLPMALGRNITGLFEKISTRVRDFMGGFWQRRSH
jgi:hypothetical protein